MFAYGMYKVHQGNAQTREQRKEKRVESRITIFTSRGRYSFPESKKEAKQIEAEIGARSSGWDVNKGVYHNGHRGEAPFYHLIDFI